MRISFLREQRVRAYLYRVASRAGAVAAVYGVVSESKLVVWLALAGALLGNELAAQNTTTTPNAEDGLEPDELAEP